MSLCIRTFSTCLVILWLATNVIAHDPRAAAELSVAPLDHLEYPKDRPKWLGNKPDFGGDVPTIVVVSEPGETPQESLETLKWMQRAAIATYVSRLTDSPGDFDLIPISDQVIEEELVSRRYSGKLIQGDGTKYEHAVELRFSKSFQREIHAAWKNVEVGRRLSALGGLASVGFVMLIASSGFVGILSRRVRRV